MMKADGTKEELRNSVLHQKLRLGPTNIFAVLFLNAKYSWARVLLIHHTMKRDYELIETRRRERGLQEQQQKIPLLWFPQWIPPPERK